ncbi:MAG TPA: FUSC family protein [Solirubrobacteraceae bacterium]|nr:FUSC family protein [Solirubrobacteraceae bacterium]
MTANQLSWTGLVEWLHAHDPGYGALRRAGRAAILMPALFALGDRVIANPEMSYFLAFGSFAMLLLVDFSGSRLDRLRSQALLGVTCALFICLGTLVSQSTALAAIGMFIVAFAVLFSGVVSSVIASATTPLLLSFILPVTVPGTASQIPDRVAGWGMAAVVSLFAITFLWPSAVAFPVELRAIAACRALAARIRAEIAWVLDGGAELEAANLRARADADAAVGALDKLFLGTPYRPTGLSTKARAEIRLVDELRWLSAVVLRSGLRIRPPHPDRAVCGVKLAAANVLDCAASVLGSEGAQAGDLRAARDQLHAALRELEQHTTSLPAAQAQPRAGNGHVSATAVISALDPGFRAQELAYITDQVASNVAFAAAAGRRTWLQRLLGRQPAGFTGPLSSAWERARAHAEPSSSWLHNSLRGATGLGVAVLVAELTSVQHGFWVVFGTLAVLRSNALSTGQNAMRGLLGTTAGFLVGGVIVALIGTNTTVLWVLLPIAVLFGGLAPTAISFAAGQAAFTVTLLILFNLLIPAGWKLGLVRVEDVALGCAVSLAVGLVFWPRGAAADLGRALGRAYVDSSSYLAEAVAYGVACCQAHGPKTEPPRTFALKAAASARRLDDTFRGYLTERGAKRVPLTDVTALVSGVVGVRLAADAVLDLWDGDGHAPARDGDRAAARQELLATAEHLTAWYDRFAASLSGAADVPEPLPTDADADGRLVEAVANDLRDGDGNQTATGVRVLWTGDHLDAVRRLQEGLVGPARTAMMKA